MKTTIFPLMLTGCAAATLTTNERSEAPMPSSEESLYAMDYIEGEDNGAGGLIGAKGNQAGSGGLGSRGAGFGGGGTADGLSGLGTKGRGSGRSGYGSGGGSMSASAPVAPPPAARAAVQEAAPAMDKDTEEPAQTRAWFPETFLFAPLVVTDETGSAIH